MAVMAADLQEPPGLLTSMFSILNLGEADIVFGQRIGREDPLLYRMFSVAFWSLYRRLVLSDMPPGGADIFACTAQVRDAVLMFQEADSSLIAQLVWLGFRRAYVTYTRLRRQHGRSAWNFRRRMKYMADSIFSFTNAPLTILFWIGTAGIVLTSVIALVVFVAWIVGSVQVPGYTPIMLFIAFVASLQMLSLSVIGFYISRIFENTKRRPLRLIASVQEFKPSHD